MKVYCEVTDDVDGGAPVFLALRPGAAQLTRTTILRDTQDANDALDELAACGPGPRRAELLGIIRQRLSRIHDYAAGNLPSEPSRLPSGVVKDDSRWVGP